MLELLGLLLAACVIGAFLGLVSATFTQGVSGGKSSASGSKTVTGSASLYANEGTNKAYTGSLTTRTSNTAGTLTMSAGHNLTTGCRFDLFWTNTDGTDGYAYGCIAGTVATNSVPFTGATTQSAGAVLPAAATAIIACVAIDTPFSVVGNSLVGIWLTCVNPAYVVFTNSVPADVFAVYIKGSSPYLWESTNGVTNPLAGATPVKVWMSSKNTTAAGTDVKAEAIFN